LLERVGQSDAYALCTTPIGPMFVAYNGLGVSAVMLAASATAFEQAFHVRSPEAISNANHSSSMVRCTRGGESSLDRL
jgi:hypothetical protein